jgi:ABC-2 type transport system permease protein
MGVRWGNIFWLGTKELRGLRADPVLLFLIAYAFSAAVYMMATGAKTEVENASVGIVDEDHSELSRRIALALLKPTFKPPVEMTADEIDPTMNSGRFVFVIEVPPKLEFDVLARRQPTVQVDTDATAMTLAGNGFTYLQNIITREAQSYVGRNEGTTTQPINLVIRAKFNPDPYVDSFTDVFLINRNGMEPILPSILAELQSIYDERMEREKKIPEEAEARLVKLMSDIRPQPSEPPREALK